MTSLEGKTPLVTGASSGSGQPLCERLAEAGDILMRGADQKM